MNTIKQKTLKTIVAIIIIFGSAATLGIKFYMDNEALSVDRPSFIKTTPNNNIALLFGNTIYISNQYKKTTSILNFDDLGLDLIGDFDFFSNGDLLVYNQQEEQTLLQNLKQYARIKETRNNLPSNANGFYRCKIQTQICKKFQNNLPALYFTFRLVIDRLTDTIYIADTPKFILYKSNSNGLLQAQNNHELLFPNQVFLYENSLYIANTNKHTIKEVQTDNKNFGAEIKSHSAVIDAENRWPSEVIKTPEGWWVGIAGSNMSHGKIQIYDNNWNKQNVVTTNEVNTDIWGMTLFNKNILVTDWDNIQIYHFNLAGQQLPNINSNQINMAFENSKQLKAYYENISSNALMAFFFVFSFGFIAAFILEKKESLALFNGPFSNSQKHDELANSETANLLIPPGKDTYWIETKSRKYRKLLSALVLLGIPFSLWFSYNLLTNSSDIEWDSVFGFLSIIPVFVLGAWTSYKTLSVKIGISGQLLLIDEGNGTIGVGKETAIKFTQNSICIGNAIAIIGQPNSPIFPKDELDKWVKPRVMRGDQISQWAFNKILWKRKHPSIVMTILIFIYLLIYSAIHFL